MAVAAPTVNRGARNDSATLAAALIKEQTDCSQERLNFETQWQEIADRILPRQADFTQTRSPGEKRTEKIFDSTGALALDRSAAALETMLTPRNAVWHSAKASDKAQNDLPEVKRYFDEANTILYDRRSQTKFHSQMHEAYMSLMAFGTCCIYSEERRGYGLAYKSIHLAELYVAENNWGEIDTVYRLFEWTARQAVQQWKDRAPKIIQDVVETTPLRKFKFLHVVKPRPDYNPTRFDRVNMPWASYYVCIDDRSLIGEGGYRTNPYAVSRFVTSPREVYGRSPAMLVLPEIKMANIMRQDMITMANRSAHPALLLHDDGVLQRASTRPGAMNMGGLNANGQKLIQPMEFGGNWEIPKEEMEHTRNTINTAFFVTLFQVLLDNPNMTATEALLRAKEKGALLAPAVGRQQAELLLPILTREFDFSARVGILPPPPKALIDTGGDYKIDFETEVTRAQRADEALGFLNTMQAITPLAQLKPEILDRINGDAALKMLADVNGVPNKVLYTDDEMKDIEAGRNQAKQAQQLLAAAPVITESIANIAKARQASTTAAF